MAVIGLSFGNSTSSIAFSKADGKVDVLANQDGDRAIPSAISYVSTDEFHGLQAKNQLIRNAKNTVINFRDFVGSPYAEIDPTYCHAAAHPIDLSGKAAFELVKTESGEKEQVPVEYIATRHFDRLRESAADYLGKDVEGAVLAVPTDFSEQKREAIVKAAADANLNIVQVINEPTAALLAHVSRENTVTPEDKIYLVADFGGTRSDAAVIASRGGVFTVLGTVHDYELGGVNLDDALVDYIAKDFEKQYNLDPKTEARSLAKLKAEAEACRKTLSNTTSSNFAVESLAGGYDYHTTVNRLRFELTGRQVFNKFVSFVEKAVQKVQLDVLDIDEVLLVGGVSCTPKIASSLAGVFDSKTKIVAPVTETKALNPSELIARGAAIQGSLLAGFDEEEINESLQPVVTVAPHTTAAIGVQLDGEFRNMVDIDTALPIRKVETFEAGSEDLLVGIYEAKSEIVEKTVEKQPKEEKAEDDDESDWSDDEDDEPETVREKVASAGKKLAELGLKGVTKGSKVEVVLSITKELKLQVAARELKSGGVAVRGETATSTVA